MGHEVRHPVRVADFRHVGHRDERPEDATTVQFGVLSARGLNLPTIHGPCYVGELASMRRESRADCAGHLSISDDNACQWTTVPAFAIVQRRELAGRQRGLVSYVSTMITLHPGDLIATGTTGGVGHARKPPRYLEHGQTIITRIEGIGELVTLVRRESLP
jgi:hypothetical protein